SEEYFFNSYFQTKLKQHIFLCEKEEYHELIKKIHVLLYSLTYPDLDVYKVHTLNIERILNQENMKLRKISLMSLLSILNRFYVLPEEGKSIMKNHFREL